MSRRLVMDQPDRRNLLDSMAQGVLGKPVPRIDGPLKVSGRADYALDHPVSGAVWGVLVCAAPGRGRVVRLDRDSIAGFPGLLTIIDDERLIRNPAQGGAGEAPVQPGQEVFYSGQPIALVVAERFEQARHAAQNLQVEYEVASAAIFHPDDPAAELERPEDKQYEQGEPERALADAEQVIDVVYQTPGHNSAAMEPHAAIAEWEKSRLTLHCSLQMLDFNRKELADCLGLETGQIRLYAPFVGGGFGSKLGISHEGVAAALAAIALQRPVKVALSRPQVFLSTLRRSETRQHIRLGASRNGQLQVIMHDSRVSNLPDESFLEPVAQATHFTYAAAHRSLGLQAARVHRTCAGSVRAPGEAVGVQAFECAMDELAEKCGMDPLALRLRNLPAKDPESGKPFSSHPFAQTLETAAADFGWQPRYTSDGPRPGTRREGDWLVGQGMAAAVRVNMLSESKARVTLQAGGDVLVETDMTDLGTGTYTILGQIAAEMLGVPLDRVDVRLGDTELPPSAGSGGSWGASSAGSSVFLACESIRAQLATRLGCAPEQLVLKDGRAWAGSATAEAVDLLAGEALVAEGHIEDGAAGDDTRQATYGGIFAEVAVHVVTGETRVRRMLGRFACGRILNEMTARSQCYGGMMWGLGMALTEALVHHPANGRIVNHDLAEYHLPVHLDTPDMDVEFIEERDPWAGPLQSKGVGELSVCGSGAAILNAIYDATGVRVRDLPATPDKLLGGLPDLASLLDSSYPAPEPTD